MLPDKMNNKMKIETHHSNGLTISELISEGIIINTIEDGKDLLGNLYYQDSDRIIIHEKNITPDFFDLKNGMAGEILQKFSNYRVRLAIVGDFSKYTGRSINAFINESNKGNQIFFVANLARAIEMLSNK